MALNDDFSDWDGIEDDFLDNYDEEELLEDAFNNSYDILTNKATYEDLIAEGLKNNAGVVAFAHDVTDEPIVEDYQHIIDYFTDLEEYEKCAILHKIMIGLT